MLALYFVSKLASHTSLDGSRLLFDLKRCGELLSGVAGCLEAEAIAHLVTQGIVEQFGCAFARIWLVESDRTSLKLVASAGLYTRLDGSFAHVPMGHFKVGKIAQNGIPFLSNALADETWVKDRAWAIENEIKGFAGLPLIAAGEAIGVLAVFSHRALQAEFLEVLQMLSVSVAGGLAGALKHQEIVRLMRMGRSPTVLSEQLVTILGPQKLSLLGVEQAINPAIADLLVEVAEDLAKRPCHYCRLIYETKSVALEAMLLAEADEESNHFFESEIAKFSAVVEQLGGVFKTQIDANRTVFEVWLQLPQQIPEHLSIQPKEAEFRQVQPPQVESPLSEREQQVITLLAQGLRDREIAEQLFISERTVKFHTKNMLAKLGVKTRIQAVFEATQQGWLSKNVSASVPYK